MRIIVIGDTHSDIENIIGFLDKIKELKPDVLIFSGDFIDVGKSYKGFSHDDIAKIIIEYLKLLNIPIVAIPGNNDRAILELLEDSGISIHGSGKVVNGVGFYGFGGAKTPFGTPLEPGEDELESGIRNGYEKVKKAKTKIQVTHAPPLNTKLDMISSEAHVGSKVVRSLIEELKPNAAVCAHIHEARGVDNIDQTKILNAGRFPEGYCGVIEIDKSEGTVTAKVVNMI
jgi:Icc-related predicted phosphoesterase